MRKMSLGLTTALIAVSLATAAPYGLAQTTEEGETKLVWSHQPGPQEPSGDWEIVMANPDGSEMVNLTNNEAEDEYPELSPDGTSIVFTRGASIFTMGSLGTGATRLTDPDFSSLPEFPTWSPDGQKIAYRAGSIFTGQIFVMNADGTNLSPVTQGLEQVGNPTWSADGSEIAFRAASPDGFYEIYAVPVGGGQPRQITNHAGFSYENLEWSPDGARFVFWHGGSTLETYTVDANGSLNENGETEGTQLSPESVDDSSVDASYSPTGDALVMLGGDDELYTMGADGSAVTQITTVGPDNAHPDWGYYSPSDGTCPIGRAVMLGPGQCGADLKSSLHAPDYKLANGREIKATASIENVGNKTAKEIVDPAPKFKIFITTIPNEKYGEPTDVDENRVNTSAVINAHSLKGTLAEDLTTAKGGRCDKNFDEKKFKDGSRRYTMECDFTLFDPHHFATVKLEMKTVYPGKVKFQAHSFYRGDVNNSNNEKERVTKVCRKGDDKCIPEKPDDDTDPDS